MSSQVVNYDRLPKRIAISVGGVHLSGYGREQAHVNPEGYSHSRLHLMCKRRNDARLPQNHLRFA